MKIYVWNVLAHAQKHENSFDGEQDSFESGVSKKKRKKYV